MSGTGQASQRDWTRLERHAGDVPTPARREHTAEHYAAYALARETDGEWRSLGPDTVLSGQAARSNPKVSGRVNAIAFSKSPDYVFAATSNGGVWRSSDRGKSWEPTMRATPRKLFLDEDPEYFRSDSLACGAVAVGGGRLYAGTGEGYSFTDSYFGIGPLSSETLLSESPGPWKREHAEEGGGNPPLEGRGFYRIAATADKVFAATDAGLYERQQGSQGARWVRRELGAGREHPQVTDVVGASSVFYAARYRDGVYRREPSDGSWAPVGGDLPGAAFGDVEGRISLAVRDHDPNVVYALTNTGRLYRLANADQAGSSWVDLNGLPGLRAGDADGHALPADGDWNDQGDINLAIALDPRAPDDSSDKTETLYVGMARVAADAQGKPHYTERGGKPGDGREWSGALFRVDVKTVGSLLQEIDAHLQDGSLRGVSLPGANPQVVVTFIGASLHPDIHALEFDDRHDLWVGCDGGVFRATVPKPGTVNPVHGDFEACNDGLQTMAVEAFGQHPERPDVLFCGCQDNGCLEYQREEYQSETEQGRKHVWKGVRFGDAGAVLVHPKTNELLVSTTKHQLQKRTGSGESATWDARDLTLAWSAYDLNTGETTKHQESIEFYPPLASAPDEPNVVATGAQQVWISEQFGGDPAADWLGTSKARRKGSANDRIRSLAFASSTRLYAGTVLVDVVGGRSVYRGAVLRYDKQADGSWNETPLPQLPHPAPVTGIAIDPATADGIYVTVGNQHDFLFEIRADGELDAAGVLAKLKAKWPQTDPYVPPLHKKTPAPERKEGPQVDERHQAIYWRLTEPDGGRVIEVRERRDEEWKLVGLVVTLAEEKGVPSACHLPRVYYYDGTKWEERSGDPPEELGGPADRVAVGQGDVQDLDKGTLPSALHPKIDPAGKAVVSVVVQGHRWHVFDPPDQSKTSARGGRLFDVRARAGKFIVRREKPRLLSVHHSAIVVDPDDPKALYAAADIGVWRSPDAGKSWVPSSCGLPDAPVLDLKLFPSGAAEPGTVRRLRAATHGRGLFECVCRPRNVIDVLCVVDGRTLLSNPEPPQDAVLFRMVTRDHRVGGTHRLHAEVGSVIRWRALSLTADEEVDVRIESIKLRKKNGAAEPHTFCRLPVAHSGERDLWEAEPLATGKAACDITFEVSKKGGTPERFLWNADLELVSQTPKQVSEADPIIPMGADREAIDILCVVDGKSLFEDFPGAADPHEVRLDSSTRIQDYCQMITRSDDCLSFNDEYKLEVGAWAPDPQKNREGQIIRWRAVSLTGDSEHRVTITGFTSRDHTLYTGPHQKGTDDLWESQVLREGRDAYYLKFKVEHGGERRNFDWDPVITVKK